MIELKQFAGDAIKGTLYGIGVGPGDVRLLTLRAASLVQTVDVIAYFAKRGSCGNSRRIVAPLIAEGREELRLEYPVTEEIPTSDPAYQNALSAFYVKSAELLGEILRSGYSVGLLSEGDPFFYGSFMHMWHRFDGEVPVEVVPGVTSMSGCWTRSNVPIVWGDDILTVLPATLPEERIAERLRNTDAAVIMKLGRNLQKVKRAVVAAGRMSGSIYAERGTMTDERIMPLGQCDDVRAPYFAMVLVPGKGRRL